MRSTPAPLPRHPAPCRSHDAAQQLERARFPQLFSYLIPISLVVDMDLGKQDILPLVHRPGFGCPGMCSPRSTTIPEELGRLSYLLSD